MPATKKAKAAPKHSKAETHLLKARLVDAKRLTGAHRKKIAKLTPGEVKALISAKKKLGSTGSLHGAGADFL